jgi:Undecaprenyl-phosphate glucose phosphotransferase
VADKSNNRLISRNILAGLVRMVDGTVCAVTAVAAFGFYLYGRGGVSYDLYYLLVGLAVIFQITAFHVAGLYRPETLRNIPYQLARVWLAWTCVFGILIAILFVSKSSAYYSRAWMIIWYLSGLIAFATIRFGLLQYLRHGLRNGKLRQRVIVVGGGDQGREVICDLKQAADSDVQILGYFDDRAERVPEEIASCRKLGTFSDVIKFVRNNQLDLVVLALPVGNGQRLFEILKKLWILPVDICLSANAAGIRFSPDIYRYVGNIPLLSVFKKPMTDWDYVVKALEDRVVAILSLAISLPLIIIIAIAIKLDSPGHVFFRQRRHGFNNELIEVWKFRTMYEEMEDPDCTVQTSRNDSRVTRVGAFLRRTSLDELPQLFNVLKGEMSIVGPRPHALETKAEGRLLWEVVDTYAARHKVKPGITGWAQVNGWRGETDTTEKIRRRVDYDLYYIENWSLWLDIWIIIKSWPIVFHDTRAY